MKNALLTLALVAAAPAAAFADVSKEDIRKLLAAGISEDVIVTFIRTRGPVQAMSADDLVELKQAGAGERVLAALAGGAAPAPRTEVVERKVYVPETPTVVASPSTYYYYSPAYSYGYPYYSPYYSYGYCYPRYTYYSYPSVGFSYSRYRHHGGWSWGIRTGWCW
jgi:hypothetical protein